LGPKYFIVIHMGYLKLLLLKSAIPGFFSLFFLISCSATEPWVSNEYKAWETAELSEDSNVSFSLFLIGDTGAPELDGPDPVFELLKAAIALETSDRAVVFLGDNIYDDGFVPEPSDERERSERILEANLDILSDPSVPGYFVPGNHDWWSSFDGMMAQEEFIKTYPSNEGHIHFTPKAGCPGPEVWYLHDSVVLVTLDSEWFIMDDGERLAERVGCEIATREESLSALRELSEQHSDKLLVLATHHPFFSRGEHGGKYTWKQHIFPGTDLHPALWVPLPVVGSLYPFIRNRGVGRQDFSSRAYTSYINDVLEQFSGHPMFISAAGHDHNLQYFNTNELHHIVSGAGSKLGYAVKGGDAGFLLADYGFAKLEIYENGEIWLEFWTTQVSLEDNPVFRYPIDRLSEQVEFSEDENKNQNVKYKLQTIHSGE
jgi:hypothetical protein